MNKKDLTLLLCVLALSSLLLQSCLQDDCNATRTFTVYEPVYLAPNEIRQSVTITEARKLENPGKLYFYQDYIFINEQQEGFHIIDNSNPKAPEIKAFVNIPGNVDIAVRNDVLYADNYMDLLTLDISQPTNPQLIHRQEDAFNAAIPFDPVQGYLIDYVKTNRTETIDCNDPNFNDGWFWRNENVFVDAAFDNFSGGVPSNGGGGNQQGTAGSLARFGIYQNFLYVIDQFDLDVFDISIKNELDQINTVHVGWGIETIFPYKDKLFIGAEDGLYIFNNEEPINPSFLSKFNHARACDPVVVNETTAYVTLRDGTECDGFINQLDIVDITDLESPRLIATHPMENPHGLALKGETVFICDGTYGLKSFDVEDPRAIVELDHEKIATYDAILLSNRNLLLVIGNEGLYQYDSSDPSDLKQLSLLPVGK